MEINVSNFESDRKDDILDDRSILQTMSPILKYVSELLDDLDSIKKRNTKRNSKFRKSLSLRKQPDDMKLMVVESNCFPSYDEDNEINELYSCSNHALKYIDPSFAPKHVTSSYIATRSDTPSTRTSKILSTSITAIKGHNTSNVTNIENPSKPVTIASFRSSEYIEKFSAEKSENTPHASRSIDTSWNLLLDKNWLPHNIWRQSPGFLVSVKEAKQTISYTFQNPKEPRIQFLIRSPLLFQEYLNSGDLNKFKSLMNEMFTRDCMFHLLTSPPLIGLDKVYESHFSLLRNSPDFYCVFSNVKRTKKRVISFSASVYGTLPFIGNKNFDERIPNAYNFLGSTSKSLDDSHKIQKLKYESLRSQKKVIKFERKETWNFILNREVNKITKFMSKTVSIEFS